MNNIKTDPNERSACRRMCLTMSARPFGQSLGSFYEGLKTFVENSPDVKKPTIFCVGNIYEQIKKLPESYMKGRWLYIKYAGKTFFVKKVRI